MLNHRSEMPFLQLSFKQKEALPSRAVEGEGMVVAVKEGKALLLNGVGFEIWQWLAQTLSGKELVQRLSQHANISEQQAAQDLQPFLQRLQDEGVLTQS